MGGVDAAWWPVLIVGFGSVAAGAMAFWRGAPMVRRVVALAAMSVALGLALHLARLNLLQPAVALGPLSPGLAVSPPRPLAAAAKLPAAATLAVLGVSFAGIWTERKSSGRDGWLLLITGAALLFALAVDSLARTFSWTCLLLGGLAAEATGRAEPDAPEHRAFEPLLALLVVGAPLLWLAGALDQGSIAARAILIVVGFATAGLPPFGRWRRSAPEGELLTDGLMPVVGYASVALGLDGAPASLVGLAGALAVFAVGTSGSDLRNAGSPLGRAVPVGRLIVALGFVVLPTVAWLAAVAVVLGLSVVVAGAILVLAAAGPVTQSPVDAVRPPLDAARDESAVVEAPRVGETSVLPRFLAGPAEAWGRALWIVGERESVAVGLLVAVVAAFVLSA